MPSYVTPKRATEFIFYASLVSQANTKIFQVNPTLAAGDVKVSIDGGALANLATLPAVTPAGGKGVKVTLSIAEMTGDNIHVVFVDAAGAEWCDLFVNLQTSVRQVDDLAWPTTTGRSVGVEASGKITGVVTTDVLTTYTGNTVQTGDSFGLIGATGSGLTSLASQVSVTTIDDFLDTEIAAILAAVDTEIATIVTATGASAIRAAVGLAAADLDTQLAAIDNFIDTEVASILTAVDTEVAAIKAKTDLIPAAPAAVGDVPTAIQNADALLNRDMATGTDSGSSSVRTTRQALRLLRNKWAIVAGTLTVNKEDDATASWTAVVTGTAGADPATAVDPAGP